MTLALLLLSTFAAGGEIQIMKISQYQMRNNAYVTKQFMANPELGRAWIEVSVTNDPDSSSDDTRIKLDGLSFDQQSNEVVLLHEGRLVVCATFAESGRWIFRQRVMKETGKCQFKGVWKKITYDNGFEIKTTRNYIISLVVE